jgi:hypothetical protein
VLENQSDTSQWSITGFMIDPAVPEFARWQESLEAFGQGIHFHGVRADRQKMGHVLTAVLSDRPFRVTMYPLGLVQSPSAGVFDNDLSLRLTQAAGPTAFTADIQNAGANFVRNVDVRLKSDRSSQTTVPVISPGEMVTVSLHSKTDASLSKRVCAELDPAHKLIEGGQMRSNNTNCVVSARK